MAQVRVAVVVIAEQLDRLLRAVDPQAAGRQLGEGADAGGRSAEDVREDLPRRLVRDRLVPRGQRALDAGDAVAGGRLAPVAEHVQRLDAKGVGEVGLLRELRDQPR